MTKNPLQFKTADTFYHTISGTGVSALNRLLGGGYEHGLMYLFYGDSVFNEDLLRAAVFAQASKENGGFESPVIVIDSSNMIDTIKLNDYSSEYELEVETVQDNIFVSRAFNSSQTYDLVINHQAKQKVTCLVIQLASLHNQTKYHQTYWS